MAFGNTNCIAAELFSGPIEYKGSIVKNVFDGDDFNVRYIDGNVLIKAKESEIVHSLSANGRIVADAVVSSNGASAALLIADDIASPEMSIVVLRGGIVVLEFPFKENSEESEFGWVVELGSVSEKGDFLLMKVAQFGDRIENMISVKHRWAVFRIASNREIKDTGEKRAFDNWSRFSKN